MKTFKVLFCVFAFLFFELNWTHSQSLIPDYAISFLAGNEDEIHKTHVDKNGDMYIVGMFKSNQLIFGTDTLVREGLNDIFILKLDVDTNVVFAKSFTNSGLSKVTGIGLDSNHNIYLSGYYQGQLTFGTFVLQSVPFKYSSFVVKLNPTAEVIWAKYYAAGSQSSSIIIDAADNLYISGRFSETFIINSIPNPINPSNRNRHFLLKMNALGNEKWLKNYGGQMMIDKQQNLYFVDSYMDSIRIENHLLSTISNKENHNVYVAKADTSGHVLWAKKFCEGEHALINGANIDTLTNTIFMTGTFKTDSLTFDTHIIRNHGTADIFIAKIDTAANVIMAKSFGSTAPDYSWGLTRISSQYMALLGTSYGDSIYFGDYLLQGGANQTGFGDFFIVIIDNFGNSVWARYFPSSSAQTFHSIIADGNENIFVIGDFSPTSESNKAKGLYSSVKTSVEPTIIDQPSLYLVKFKLGNTPTFLTDSFENSLNLFPNPSSTYLNIKLDGFVNTFTLDIFNTEGKIILKKKLVQGVNSIEIQSLAKGIYFVQIESEDNRIVKKFIKN